MTKEEPMMKTRMTWLIEEDSRHPKIEKMISLKPFSEIITIKPSQRREELLPMLKNSWDMIKE